MGSLLNTLICWLFRVLVMKISDKFGIQNVASQNPGSLFWAMALPVHKVLETSTLPARANQVIH